MNVPQVQEQRLAHSKSSLYITVATTIACLPAIAHRFDPCFTGGKTEVRSHLAIYSRWHSEQIGKRKTRSPSRQPNSLPKSQFNLATLLLSYKMNNCLWVHSQAHYCLSSTSKNLRQAKDTALLIVLRSSTFPSCEASLLMAHFEHRNPSLTKDFKSTSMSGQSCCSVWC